MHKESIILIAFLICGILFLLAGMYFLSNKFLQSLQEAASSPEKQKAALLSGKISGYVSLGIGGFTVFCGIITKLMPQIFQYLAIAYVIILIAGFIILSASIKIPKTTDNSENNHE